MGHNVPRSKQRISHFSFPAVRIFSISIALSAITFCMSGCASQQTKAWNHYEEGMLLVYKGYDATGDKTDKVEKAFNQAIECNKDLPGVRASLGTYKAKKGDSAGATELWIEEKKIHPEAKKAMDVVLEKNKDKEKEKDKENSLVPEVGAVPEKPAAVEMRPGDKQTESVKDEKKNV